LKLTLIEQANRQYCFDCKEGTKDKKEVGLFDACIFRFGVRQLFQKHISRAHFQTRQQQKYAANMVNAALPDFNQDKNNHGRTQQKERINPGQEQMEACHFLDSDNKQERLVETKNANGGE
jgi:hypothetical protein